MSSTKTRVQYADLSPKHLESIPIWEFVLDEEGEPDQDETTLRPFEGNTIPSDACSLLVKAEFTLANGDKYPGHIQITTANTGLPYRPGLFNWHPSMFIGEKGFIFWLGDFEYINVEAIEYFQKAIDLFFELLRLTPEEIFPIKAKATCLVEGEEEPREIAIDGFQYHLGKWPEKIVATCKQHIKTADQSCMHKVINLPQS